jgi:hypothetical protein
MRAGIGGRWCRFLAIGAGTLANFAAAELIVFRPHLKKERITS